MSNYSESFEQGSQFQDVLSNSIKKLGCTEIETISLIFEDDHFHMILESMKEVQQGNVVTFQTAFSDLS